MTLESDTLLKLADAAKQIGGQAWLILVRQEFFDGCCNLLVILAFLVGSPIALRKLYRWSFDEDRNYNNETPKDLGLVFGALFLATLFTVAAVSLPDNLEKIVYPEGAALHSLVKSCR